MNLFTYHSSKEPAAEVLSHGIKQHLIDYKEDHKEYEFDEAPEREIDQMYAMITKQNDPPSGWYELE